MLKKFNNILYSLKYLNSHYRFFIFPKTLRSMIIYFKNLKKDFEVVSILKILVDKEKCTGCGECRNTCPKGPKIWKINKIAHASNLEFCHVCTICASKCPEGAIEVVRNGSDDESN